MHLSFKRTRRTEALPAEVVAAVGLGRGERVLCGAMDADSRAWLVASNHALALVRPDRGLAWKRPWHEVDRGSWHRERALLTVTWADRSRLGQWRLEDETVFLQTLRERVQASVVLAEELQLTGRRTGRAVIRQDLATGDLLEQVVLGRGVQADEEVAAESRRALAWLREQVGMPS